jgi:hypothetical protein
VRALYAFDLKYLRHKSASSLYVYQKNYNRRQQTRLVRYNIIVKKVNEISEILQK